MKLKNMHENSGDAGVGRSFRNDCAACYQKILAQVAAVKAAIFNESLKTLKTHERLLRLALNEAEAAAWQTMYPHLLFPTLALEKVRAVTDWNEHQQFVQRGNRVF